MVLLFFVIASPLVCGAGLAVRVEGCYRTLEFAARRPRHEQNAAGTGVPQFQNPLLATACVHSRLDVDRIVCQNLLDLGWPNTVCGDVSFVVLIPVIPGTRLHVNTLYRHL